MTSDSRMRFATGKPALDPGVTLTMQSIWAVPKLLALAIVAILLLGCGQIQHRLLNNAPVEGFVPNPIEVPALPDTTVWNQVVDTVDDYFDIAREQPVVNSGGLISDGRLESQFKVGGSILEPWRKDSTAGFERMQSTLQSIRRRAIVTVRPAASSVMSDSYLDEAYLNGSGQSGNVQGYVIEVVVMKDLEDAADVSVSNTDVLAKRHDGTVVRRGDRFDDTPITLGWIPLGRDTALEQRILSDIFGRLTQHDAGKHGR